MCERIAAALAAGEPLTESQVAHVATCSTCKRTEAIVHGWRPVRVDGPTTFDVQRTKETVLLRRVRRVALLAAAMTLAAIWAWPRPTPAPEPDLFAALDEAEAVYAPNEASDELLDEIDQLLEPDFETFDIGDL